MFCNRCGAENADGAKFCRQCGNLLNGVETKEKKNNKVIYIVIGAIVIIIAIVLAIVLGMRGKKAKEYETCLASAEKYIEELNYEQAKDYYLQAIRVAPRELEPYVRLAGMYVDLEEIEKAEEILAMAEENNADGSAAVKLELEAIVAAIDEIKQQEENVSEAEDLRWKDKYIEFIENERINENPDMQEYKLLDINGDDIPELYINFGTTAGGEVVCTYMNGQFYEQRLWVYGMSYIEGENILMNTGGHQGAYYDDIYKITEDGFQLIIGGYYHEKTENSEAYEYYWNEKEVSESEYNTELAKYFDKDRATMPHYGSFFNFDTGHNEGGGMCLYDEIIKQIEAYPELPEVQENVEENVEETNDDLKPWEIELEQTEQESEELEVLLNNAMSQYDLNQYSYQLYKLWDDEINRLWQHLKDNLDEDEMEALTEVQREWIKEKEAAIEDAGKEWEGGSGQPMAENTAGWTMTEERVYELIEYLR